MLLKIYNGDKIALARGNHEEPNMTLIYGFTREFNFKFDDSLLEDQRRVYQKIERFYNYLPLVLYVGAGTRKQFLHCCHGGLEIGYKPTDFLRASQAQFHYIERFERATYATIIDNQLQGVLVKSGDRTVPLTSLCRNFVPFSTMNPHHIGLLWNYFHTKPMAQCCVENKQEIMTFNKPLTEALLALAGDDDVSVEAIIRAHQHIPEHDDELMQMMLKNKGCAWLYNTTRRLSRGTVLTLLLAPDSLFTVPFNDPPYQPFAGFTFDTSLLIKIPKEARNMEDWELTAINNDIYEEREKQ